MKTTNYIFIIFFLITFLPNCNQFDAVYSDYNDSPIKLAETTPLFFPVPTNLGNVATITSEGDTMTYNLEIINRNGDISSTTFTLTFPTSHQETHRDDNKDDSKDQNGNEEKSPTMSKQSMEYMTTKIDISSGKLRTNSLGEIFFDFYSTNSFGREYYAVLKFDELGNKCFQIDSTVSAVGGMGGDSPQASTSTKLPIAGTPLDNGGYAIILQTPNQSMMQSTSYNLGLRIIDKDGQITTNTELEFSQDISISFVESVSGNIFIYYATESGDLYLKVFSQSGDVLADLSIDYIPINFFVYNNNAYIYAIENQNYYIIKVDSISNELSRIECSLGDYYCNLTILDNNLCFSGLNFNTTNTYTSISSYYQFAGSFNGKLLITDTNLNLLDDITLDYDDGIICYSSFKTSEGGYDVFLTRISAQNTFNNTINTSWLGNSIYIYNVPTLNILQIN